MIRNQESKNQKLKELFDYANDFARRHIGPDEYQKSHMLEVLDLPNVAALIDQTVPDNIRMEGTLNLPDAASEKEALAEMTELAEQNKIYRSLIGMGYYGTITPAVIQRSILENPAWYTQYTPYQAEISQGRLEALLNFQTMVADLTSLDMANSSLLDEATAAAEAMMVAKRSLKRKSTANTFFVDANCHPQTLAVIQTRAEPMGINVEVGDATGYEPTADTFGVIVQYPGSDGTINDYSALAEKVHAHNGFMIAATDLLALTLLKAPGEWGADMAIGSTQRFGVPLGFGGPHAAFMAVTDKIKRNIPGRIIGVSQDRFGKPAMRLALQSREQHIRRDSATSNICTAQVLLAIIASMYAVYHGPVGLKRIAQRIQMMTTMLADGLKAAGYTVTAGPLFDTLVVSGGPKSAADLLAAGFENEMNFRQDLDGAIGLSLDEHTDIAELSALADLFGATLADAADVDYGNLTRESEILSHPIFNTHHSETAMMRYIRMLEQRDLSLVHSMIALGSCTMKLNAATEMMPVTMAGFGDIHPFAPQEQTAGYRELFKRLETWLAEITGFAATSLQPNAGSQGEYAGLLAIRGYHRSNGDDQRNICLIPSSAHGTNPASAVMAGMKVVVTACDDEGNIDVDDLRAKAAEHSEHLAALMVTYPSTHGVFEASIVEICNIIHENGGQVYMDGANMNAQVGLCRPGDFGPDVCHLNLHKTFCIPHGGGGPGMGPICVQGHLAPFLPSHPLVEITGECGGDGTVGPVSAAPWGSPSILPIPYAYIRMMGAAGLKDATETAILNANYIAERLGSHFPVLYKGASGRVAHECIIDLRHLKEIASNEDVAKRLMDYGFHAPTMSFPVPGTLMIEPTESENLAEIDRFCRAMIQIREEFTAIENGSIDAENNPLKNAPHTADEITSAVWDHPYSREEAAFPVDWVRENKFWPFVARIDNAFGDRNLVCNCLPIDAYEN